MPTNYRGRFAPSPTGPLHFGSLIAAVGSYLEADKQQGEWLLRMEDLDPPREMLGAADNILRCLEAFAFEWSGEVLYQSQRQEAYQAALQKLKVDGLIFDCGCTRKELTAYPLYPGTCRNGLPNDKQARAIRVRALESIATIHFNDQLQGTQQQNISQQLGDFVIRRADGLFAYQLAVVVDDAAQGITDIVRGSDLLDVTCRQIYLQQLLKVKTPHYMHLPIATNASGKKLSKQTLAQALDDKQPSLPLCQALFFLGQQPPSELQKEDITTIWQWAKKYWQKKDIPQKAAIVMTD